MSDAVSQRLVVSNIAIPELPKSAANGVLFSQTWVLQ